MWAWGISTKGVTSRFRWRRTSISWPWRGTWNATRLRANLVVRGRVALFESLEALSWNCGGQGGLGRVAVGGSGRLAGASQSRRQRERVGGATPQRPARAAVWRDGMAETDCQASRPGIGVPLAGSAGHARRDAEASDS